MSDPSPPFQSPHPDSSDTPRVRQSGFTGLQVAALVGLAVIVSAGLTYWILRTHLWPVDFEPVELTRVEQNELDAKLRALGIEPPPAPRASRSEGGPKQEESDAAWLRPEPYAEDPSHREISLSERELNALLAHNTDLARKLAIDLSEDLASARLLIPVDPDLPILGGKTLRVSAGLEISVTAGRPVVIVRGVSLMGVPIPNAWLGQMKNVDLVAELGGRPGVWKSISDGIEFAQIREGELRIRLRE